MLFLTPDVVVGVVSVVVGIVSVVVGVVVVGVVVGFLFLSQSIEYES